jgi:hypothetical protein
VAPRRGCARDGAQIRRQPVMGMRPIFSIALARPFSCQSSSANCSNLKEAVPGMSRVALLMKPDDMPDRVREDRLKVELNHQWLTV